MIVSKVLNIKWIANEWRIRFRQEGKEDHAYLLVVPEYKDKIMLQYAELENIWTGDVIYPETDKEIELVKGLWKQIYEEQKMLMLLMKNEEESFTAL